MNLQDKLNQYLKDKLPLESVIYKLTRKEITTPRGLKISKISASARRTSAKDSTGRQSGWRTPQAHNASQGPKSEAFYLECVKTGKSAITLTDEARHAEVSGWPTPRSTEIEEDYEVYLRRMRNSKHAKNRGKTKPNNVAMTAQIAGWATPNTMDTLPIRSDESLARAKQKAGCSNLKDQVPITGWATPNTMDVLPARSDQAMYNQARNGGRKNRSFPGNLREQVDERTQKCYQDAKQDAMKGITQSSGYTAGITSTGQLNPALSRWLMGIPKEWCVAAIVANRLMIKESE